MVLRFDVIRHAVRTAETLLPLENFWTNTAHVTIFGDVTATLIEPRLDEPGFSAAGHTKASDAPYSSISRFWRELFSASPLPLDIVRQARDRVRIAALAFAGVWGFALLMNEVVVRFSGPLPPGALAWGPRQTWLALSGFTISIAVASVVTRLENRPYLAMDLGLALEIVNAFVASFVIEFQPRTETQAVSWVCLSILLYPAIAPASTRKTFIAAIISASSVPVALLYAHLTLPDYNPPLFIVGWLVLPAYICAFLAFIPATVIRSLGAQVKRARELGSYQLLEPIGHGGMGQVYRAKHRLLARPAAVKIISPSAIVGSGAEEARVVIERFRREAEAAASLRSPHTIELYDYGSSDDGTFYYVMELLDGIDLHELVERNGPVPAERAVHLLRQACKSLGEAHLAGLVHRDVKPSNIFACRLGGTLDFVKVLDFGLVKKARGIEDQDAELTSAGELSGTPSYMAPESIAGSGVVGPPADVYALGCVAYWLLTGRNVFQAPNAAMMIVQHLQALPSLPSVHTAAPIGDDLDGLVLRCLSKDPNSRPANATELEVALAGVELPAAWTEARAASWWNEHHPGTPGPAGKN